MTEEHAQRFLSRLWELQAAAGLTDAQLARRVGVTPSYISLLKRGQRGKRLSLRFALKAVAAFPILLFLLGGELPIVEHQSTMSKPEETE